MKEIYLYGAGGHAKVILDILQEKEVSVKAIFDDNTEIKELLDIPVEAYDSQSPLIISIGNNRIRKEIADKLTSVSFETAISRRAVVSERASIGSGTVVMQGAVVQSCAEVGKHAIINTGATVDHDCVIGDYVHIAPGCTLCGNVTVGEGTFIGAGTVIIPGVKIGKWAVIGAGSVIRKDIPDNVMAVGNPCITIKTLTI